MKTAWFHDKKAQMTLEEFKNESHWCPMGDEDFANQVAKITDCKPLTDSAIRLIESWDHFRNICLKYELED